jgi:2-hydroxycyclohexanecarboxyl-CoA dehydrogenase
MTHDPVYLITGATGPLGRAAASRFAAEGARLGLAGRDRGRLVALASDLHIPDDRWVAAVGDLRDEATAKAAVEAVATSLGPIDVLLHLVGGWTGGTALTDLDPEVLDDMLGRHVWSTFHVARAVVPGMVERGWGRIIAVTSSTVGTPGPRIAPYAAAKTAQEAMLRVLAREVAGQGVTVNLLSVKAIDAEHERDAAPSPKNAGWTTPEEMVETIRFLCSSAGDVINGALIPLGGTR